MSCDNMPMDKHEVECVCGWRGMRHPYTKFDRGCPRCHQPVADSLWWERKCEAYATAQRLINPNWPLGFPTRETPKA